MTNEKASKTEVIAATVERVSDSKGLAAIGHGIGWGVGALSVACIFVSIAFLPAAQKWDGHLQASTKCFDLKEVSGRVFKVNTCNGDVEELKNEKEIKAKGH